MELRFHALQILAIGQGLVAVIENLWAHLQRSLKATPFGNISSGQINSDLGRMDDQLEEFMSLKPGNQEIDAVSFFLFTLC